MYVCVYELMIWFFFLEDLESWTLIGHCMPIIYTHPSIQEPMYASTELFFFFLERVVDMID